MRAQLRRRAAKKMKNATSAAENTVATVKFSPRREKVFASGSLDIRRSLSAVSMTSTAHDRTMATVTSFGAPMALLRSRTSTHFVASAAFTIRAATASGWETYTA